MTHVVFARLLVIEVKGVARVVDMVKHRDKPQS